MHEAVFVSLKIAYFLSLLLTGLAMAPALAHLLELPNKINLSREHYLIVQQNYRGWALLGIVVIGALFLTLLSTIMLRRWRRPFIFSLIAFLTIAGTQIIFWVYTQPANLATGHWTMLPDSWEALRRQWEYSHAASAGIYIIAFVSLILSVLTHRPSAAADSR